MSESARAHLLAKTDDKMTPFPLGPSAAIQKQPLAGSVLSEVLLATLKNQSIPVTPHYLVKTKEAVEPNQPARAQLRYVWCLSPSSSDRDLGGAVKRGDAVVVEVVVEVVVLTSCVILILARDRQIGKNGYRTWRNRKRARRPLRTTTLRNSDSCTSSRNPSARSSLPLGTTSASTPPSVASFPCLECGAVSTA